MPNEIGHRTRTTPDLAQPPSLTTSTHRSKTMNKDQVNGRAQTVKGNVKEAAGKLVGNERLTAEGQAEQVAGKVQSKVGDVKNDVGNAIKNAIDRESQRLDPRRLRPSAARPHEPGFRDRFVGCINSRDGRQRP